jgi:hypothetical protein
VAHVLDEAARSPRVRNLDRFSEHADDALLLLVVLNRREIFASERKVQSRRTFVSVCSPERPFFALKFGEFLVGSAHEMVARRLSNPCLHN